MSKNLQRLMKAAKENIDENTIAAFDVEPEGIELGNTLLAEEETAATALESIMESACRLDRLDKAIKDVPESKATPELFEVVQATIMNPDEPAIATESDDVTDVKPGAWEKTKGFASNAAKVAAEAAKAAWKQLLELIERFFNWATSSRRSTQKQIAQAKAAMAKAPNQVEVKYTSRMKPLTVGDAFNPQTAKAALTRYATVSAATAFALDDAFTISVGFMSWKANGTQDMANTFYRKTQGALNWKTAGGPQGEVETDLYSGEGGMNVKVMLSAKNSVSMVNVAQEKQEGEVNAVSATFTKAQASELLAMSEALLRGVEKMEPMINKTRSAIYKLAGVAQPGTRIAGRPVGHYIAAIRSFINLASKYGINAALGGAHASARLAVAFTQGEQFSENEQKQSAPQGLLTA